MGNVIALRPLTEAEEEGPYLLFAGTGGEGVGRRAQPAGWDSFVGMFESLRLAVDFASLQAHDWAHVVAWHGGEPERVAVLRGELWIYGAQAAG